MIYEKFDIIVVPFPFTDKFQEKRRPALVCSSFQYFNKPIEHLVAAMITSAKNDEWPLDVVISNLKSTGLTNDSVIRMKLFTLDHRCIVKKIGSLSSVDQKAFSKNFKKLLS